MRVVRALGWLVLTSSLAAGPLACSDKAKKDRSSRSDDDDRKKDDKKKDNRSAAPNDSAAISVTASPGTSASGPVASGTYPDIDQLIGPKGQWLPTPFLKLKHAMTPAQAALVMPGADKVSEFGFAQIKPQGGQPGVRGYELTYLGAKEKLAFVEIQFEPALTSEAFWSVLLAAMTKKHGTTYKTSSPRELKWTAGDFSTATLREEEVFDTPAQQSIYVISVMTTEE